MIEDRDRSVKPPWTRLLVSRFTDPAYTVRPDTDLTIDGWNHGIELTLGWSAAEAIGRPAEERLRPTIDAGARRKRVETMRRRRWWSGTAVLLDRDDRPVAFEGRCYAVGQGQDARYLTVLRVLPERDAGFPRAGNRQADGAVVDSHSVFATADIKQTIGRNIRQARERAGINQRQLAFQLEINPSRLNDYEHGRIRPHDNRLAEIAKLTGVPSIGWFYDLHGEQ